MMAKTNASLKANNDLVNKEIRSRFNNNNRYNETDLNNNNNPELIDQQQKFSLNFNNAVFNRNFLEPTNLDDRQQKKELNYQQRQATTMESSVVNLGNMIGNEPVYMSDDLALLPHIDDKTLLNVLKSKFEMQKYHVRPKQTRQQSKATLYSNLRF